MKAFPRVDAFASIAVAASCAVVGLIWLPIGHAMMGLIEE